MQDLLLYIYKQLYRLWEQNTITLQIWITFWIYDLNISLYF